MERLVDQLVQCLEGLPAILGVCLTLVKLHIFDDCEVVICMKTGSWNPRSPV